MNMQSETQGQEKNLHGLTPDEYKELLNKYRDVLEYVEGIGPIYAKKLKDVGILTPLDLLDRGRFPKGREEIAQQTGISKRLILDWVNQIDMYRINGLDKDLAELLVYAGVDSVIELAQRNPAHLYEKVIQVNQTRRLAPVQPTQEQVEGWIERAKVLPRVIRY
jgi:hypothetical protein